MNHQFKNWTRSTAFRIDLAERHVVKLLDVYAWELDLRARNIIDIGAYADPCWARSDASYLVRRGMLEIDEQYGRYVTTRVGRLTAELLIEAGFTLPFVGDMHPSRPKILAQVPV